MMTDEARPQNLRRTLPAAVLVVAGAFAATASAGEHLAQMSPRSDLSQSRQTIDAAREQALRDLQARVELLERELRDLRPQLAEAHALASEARGIALRAEQKAEQALTGGNDARATANDAKTTASEAKTLAMRALDQASGRRTR